MWTTIGICGRHVVDESARGRSYSRSSSRRPAAAHIRATRNTGVTQDEVKEVLLQVAVYAGAPAANSAFAVAKKTYKEMASEGK